MSVDNVLAISAVAVSEDHGGPLTVEEAVLVIIGLTTSILIIFFASGLVAKLMNKIPALIYIWGAILAYTAVDMIFKDSFLINVPGSIGVLAAIAMAIVVLIYGLIHERLIKKGGN
jgi:predicted tellurium resistance membrane protein TerC